MKHQILTLKTISKDTKMKNMIINNEVINLDSMKEDLVHAVQQGFKGFSKMTPEIVLEMLNMLTNSSMVVNKDVPRDYENPNWNGGNRIYEWKNYIAKEHKELWNTFPHSQKVILSQVAHKKAMSESWE